jgi:biotin carboxylase
MSHLLVIELPGGNDTDILQAAIRMGHSFAFLTQDISVYQNQPSVFEWVNLATEIIEVNSFEDGLVQSRVLKSHTLKPFDAAICLLDIRLIETAKIAQKLNLRYLNVESAKLLRDKFNVREKLKKAGIEQPEFALATTNDEIQSSIQQLGLPLLLKPSDGYGSQNILTLTSPEDLELAKDLLADLLPIAADYGLGVTSNDRLLIERYMKGVLIGCDTLTSNGKHTLLGINEKLMFTPPSFAIKGGCFLPNKGEWAGLEKYLQSLLDAVGFDCGAAHIEIMVTSDGPRLVEINPRLVGAKIPRLVSYALNCSIHELLIDLHLGANSFKMPSPDEMNPAVTRWFISEKQGILDGIQLPAWTATGVKCVEILTKKGDSVGYPFENAQRLGYVMTCCSTRDEAEKLAEQYISDAVVSLKAE